MDHSITVKLIRDQARAVQENFFPYMEMLIETKISDAKHNLPYIEEALEDYSLLLNRRAVFMEVLTRFSKKLSSIANKFTFKFSEAQALTLYHLLMELPINRQQVWLINLRQLITDTLYSQMPELQLNFSVDRIAAGVSEDFDGY